MNFDRFGRGLNNVFGCQLRGTVYSSSEIIELDLAIPTGLGSSPSNSSLVGEKTLRPSPSQFQLDLKSDNPITDAGGDA
jgi:hypothetical protein